MAIEEGFLEESFFCCIDSKGEIWTLSENSGLPSPIQPARCCQVRDEL
jgi:hypothetical protein